MQHARNFPYLSHMQPGIDSVMRLDGHTSSEFSSRPPCAELTRFFWHVLAAGKTTGDWGHAQRLWAAGGGGLRASPLCLQDTLAIETTYGLTFPKAGALI